jgi:hypothetical protein
MRLNLAGISTSVSALAPAALAIAVAIPGPQGDAWAAELVPHRAIYSLSLGETSSPSQFAVVGGAVRTALEKTCDAWITAERINMQVTTQDGTLVNQDLMYTGWESLDGRRYRFAAYSITNGEKKRFKGTARSDPKAAGEAVYSQPKKIAMRLPPGTRFYLGLTSWLIDQAKAGKSRAETVIFDGTDEEGPQRAIVFIVPLKKPAAGAKNKLGPLLDRPGWTMRIAFYPLGGRAAEPDYEVQAVVLDNGVTPKLDLVFNSFTAVQTLEKIEALEQPKC